MEDPVFKIENLRCEYMANSPVLELKELELARGQVIFVIGKSGIGKSTFIETLGLMNETIAPEESTSIQFFPEGEELVELKNSWSLPNEELSSFRKKYFSFVFQNTNLMPNFSAGENMMMSLLINEEPIEEAKKAVLRVMDRLSLEAKVFDKKITALSGGQRQRLAFVRAVTAKFAVLFGDEPTGNLDENTAHELMGILKELIREENKTGIIVSHDLSLAKDFADVVIPITVNPAKMIGEVQQENIIRRQNGKWTTMNNESLDNPIGYLGQFLNVETIM